MWLADRFSIPAATRAILFDMDGVLIDSLSQDCEVVGELLAPFCGSHDQVPRTLIRRYFALALDDFWRVLGGELNLVLTDEDVELLVAKHELVRRQAKPIVHDGVLEILDAARRADLACAVVSNNPRSEIENMLEAAELLRYVTQVTGNDELGQRRKPAPDPYVSAANGLGVATSDCVAVEDSIIGLESAHSAGCYTIGVGTGANTVEELAASGFATQCYNDFTVRR
ncbi:HAD-superfamily hydrolase [Actinoplanes friuliensis DSM 7358]|uniref:HAD-superfamily hydrolase n=1 Tax=Actinoplanes friuliensis DSM 7358 TaxID=1246995 RepID=U5VW31_9ACTN|nr:HAD-superfamily hydrolase [Actinoplanes friuliensis DSM 7358]